MMKPLDETASEGVAEGTTRLAHSSGNHVLPHAGESAWLTIDREGIDLILPEIQLSDHVVEAGDHSADLAVVAPCHPLYLNLTHQGLVTRG